MLKLKLHRPKLLFSNMECYTLCIAVQRYSELEVISLSCTKSINTHYVSQCSLHNNSIENTFLDYYSQKYLRWHWRPQICAGVPQMCTAFSVPPACTLKLKITVLTDSKTNVKLYLPRTSFKCFNFKSEFSRFVNSYILIYIPIIRLSYVS